MSIENLKKSHASAMHACQLAEQQLEQARHVWKQRIANGAGDDELDRLEIDRLKLERNIERLRVKEQQAYTAIAEAEAADMAKCKKQAADHFQRTHASMAALIEDVQQAAESYAAAVSKIEAMQQPYFDAGFTAQQLNAKPVVTALRIPFDLQGVAKRAVNLPAQLNARFN
ncbi:hypothetical protein GBK02_15395 [Dechloromonas sp. TW-R-39-2]|uniref:hypothetical protein n=1 Tax=Dechloromonas sp. TW-R-39-2 TaxID=2654218 RepID=UPI00193DDE95|nr:hypothetical protein [Dechloromonas sp. TW-R-39-2]QRM20665.1 hypothetical protein GBK02_15395 [Dechloromonas sp. TW-R-39-2]